MLRTSCTTILRAEINVCSCIPLHFLWKMVQKLRQTVHDYEKRLQEMSFVPKSSYGSRMLREDGGPNSDFLA